MSNPGPNSPVGATLVATPPESRASTLPQNSARSLWLWVGAAFLFLGLLWTALFLAARSARIKTVPLAPKGARP
ncbi:MAG: hypothetical protein HYV75_03685 [Opitutae bacterium]|nr:hypothetical protein [Opitutae bacterium]